MLVNPPIFCSQVFPPSDDRKTPSATLPAKIKESCTAKADMASEWKFEDGV